ncbi:hypothetical protein [Streptomyces coeruleofuscus]|uniref:Serine protease n=1 Tax=Streptomyces coeruleofuscus TaxID=66879 RepID=A0ABP5VE01_9ACTN
MSKPFDYADGATGGEPQGPPNVYLPQGAAPPAYDAYADPAAAHGWQDAYGATGPGGGPNGMDGAGDDPHAHRHSDAPGAYPGHAPGRPHPGGTGGVGGADTGETRELPVVPSASVPAPGRSRTGHRARRKPRPWQSRRVAVAAGAVGAVAAAVLIAGVSLSDSPSGGTQDGEDGRTGSSSGESPTVSPTGTGREEASGAPLDGRAEDREELSGDASASPSAEGSRTPSPSATGGAPPPAGDSTTSAPAAPAPTTTTAPPGRTDEKPGRGPGGTKGPK